MSDKSSSRKILGQHYDNYPKEQQDVIRAEIESYGFEVERLRSEYISRWVFNIFAFPYYMRDKNDYDNDRFVEQQLSLF